MYVFLHKQKNNLQTNEYTHNEEAAARNKYNISSHLKYVIVLSGKRVNTQTDRHTHTLIITIYYLREKPRKQQQQQHVLIYTFKQLEKQPQQQQ